MSVGIICTALAANCLYLFISSAVLYFRTSRRMFELWSVQQAASQAAIDDFFVYWYFTVFRLGVVNLLFFSVLGCIVILIGHKFWNETAKKITSVLFYIFTAAAAIYEVLFAVLIFCGTETDACFAEATLCIVLAGTMIMADVMFAKIRKKG
ncbi:MAG: hypothetical protein IJR45_01490 [Firmicutes bacterium]|nr:hypothetical protein [Bacillota bacterium]